VGECFHIKSGSNGSAAVDVFDDVTIDHNTCDNDAGSWMLLQDNPDRFTNLTITNNIGRSKNWFSVLAIPSTNGGTAGLDVIAPGSYTVSNNVWATHGAEWPFPPDNWFEQVLGNEAATLVLYRAIFTNIDISDYTVAVGSAYKAGGTRDSLTGTSLGVNMALLPQGVEEEEFTPMPPYRLRFR
jgi:hypothetical protein